VKNLYEMGENGLERCDIFENPDDLDGMRCRANRRRKKNTRMPCGGIPKRLAARRAVVGYYPTKETNAHVGIKMPGEWTT